MGKHLMYVRKVNLPYNSSSQLHLNTFGHKTNATLITLLLGKEIWNDSQWWGPKFFAHERSGNEVRHPRLDKFAQNKVSDVFSSNDQCLSGVIGCKFHFLTP